MIFYVDDDIDDLELFSDVVQELGRSAYTFSTIDDFMRQLHTPPPFPAMIFLDINMPRRSGLELLEEIRADQKWDDVPIIMLSTSTSQNHIEQSRNLKANMYIPKSADFSLLKESIKFTVEMDFKNFMADDSGFIYKKNKSNNKGIS